MADKPTPETRSRATSWLTDLDPNNRSGRIRSLTGSGRIDVKSEDDSAQKGSFLSWVRQALSSALAKPSKDDDSVEGGTGSPAALVHLAGLGAAASEESITVSEEGSSQGRRKKSKRSSFWSKRSSSRSSGASGRSSGRSSFGSATPSPRSSPEGSFQSREAQMQHDIEVATNRLDVQHAKA